MRKRVKLQSEIELYLKVNEEVRKKLNNLLEKVYVDLNEYKIEDSERKLKTIYNDISLIKTNNKNLVESIKIVKGAD